MNKHPLKIYLDEHGWSVAVFIERKKLSLSGSFIQQMIEGSVNPSRVSAAKISAVTNIPIEVLMFPETYSNFTPKPKKVQ